MRTQLDTLSFSPRRYTNLPAIDLAQKLVELAPGDLGKVLFAPGGTSAIGMALKLARIVTGRHKTISMWDSFHGASLDAISVGGEALFRANMGPLMPGTEHVPPAEPYNCFFNPGGDLRPLRPALRQIRGIRPGKGRRRGLRPGRAHALHHGQPAAGGILATHP